MSNRQERRRQEKLKKKQENYKIHGIFPTPVYITHRKSDLNLVEKKEIEDIIIKEGMKKIERNSTSINTYIFNTKLFNLKEFCEQQLKIYIEQVINPKKELDFYITQSWLSVTRPGESHHVHKHPNSLISGVFYVSTVEDDKITFYDTAAVWKERLVFETIEFSIWNSSSWFFPVQNNVLILFPSWLDHGVVQNKNATTDRISLAFNTFTKGIFGSEDEISELIL